MSTKNSKETAINEGKIAEEKALDLKSTKPEIRVDSGKKGNLVYLGPTIKGTIQSSTTFKDGILPKRVQDCLEELPLMERLFVGIDEMPKAVKELKKRQSALSVIYMQTVQRFTGGK